MNAQGEFYFNKKWVVTGPPCAGPSRGNSRRVLTFVSDEITVTCGFRYSSGWGCGGRDTLQLSVVEKFSGSCVTFDLQVLPVQNSLRNDSREIDYCKSSPAKHLLISSRFRSLCSDGNRIRN